MRAVGIIIEDEVYVLPFARVGQIDFIGCGRLRL